MLVKRLTMSKLHINGIEGTDNISLTNVKSLTVYSLLARALHEKWSLLKSVKMLKFLYLSLITFR